MNRQKSYRRRMFRDLVEATYSRWTQYCLCYFISYSFSFFQLYKKSNQSQFSAEGETILQSLQVKPVMSFYCTRRSYILVHMSAECSRGQKCSIHDISTINTYITERRHWIGQNPWTLQISRIYTICSSASGWTLFVTLEYKYSSWKHCLYNHFYHFWWSQQSFSIWLITRWILV